MRLFGRAAILCAAAAGVALRAAGAQWSGSLDLSAARVEYDGFLPSGALAASPSLRYHSATGGFAVRATWLGFESGNSSVQALLAGSVNSRPTGPWLGELGGAAGASTYGGVAFAHALARARGHYLLRGGGLWLGATLGGATYDGLGQRVAALGAGLWRGHRAANVTISMTSTWVSDTAYADLEGAAYWQHGRFDLQGSLGVRGGRGGGRGVYGEAVATIALSRAIGLTLGAGRYPTDPVRGSVSGRYASAGVRITGLAPRPAPQPAPAWPVPAAVPAVGTNGHAAAAVAEIEAGVLLIRAPGAALVEVMGDFTDWQPVALSRSGDLWRCDVRLSAGLRRLNVRVDGGAWIVPLGATTAHDEFGATVGTIVVP